MHIHSVVSDGVDKKPATDLKNTWTNSKKRFSGCLMAKNLAFQNVYTHIIQFILFKFQTCCAQESVFVQIMRLNLSCVFASQLFGMGSSLNIWFISLAPELSPWTVLESPHLLNVFVPACYNESYIVWFYHRDSLHWVVRGLPCECSNIWLVNLHITGPSLTLDWEFFQTSPRSAPRPTAFCCKSQHNIQMNYKRAYAHTATIPTCTLMYWLLYAHWIKYAQKKSHH